MEVDSIRESDLQRLWDHDVIQSFEGTRGLSAPSYKEAAAPHPQLRKLYCHSNIAAVILWVDKSHSGVVSLCKSSGTEVRGWTHILKKLTLAR